ncbi:nitroreductase family deazaflavin-dependent oxidoreductase [Nocardia cyriacigeorgica]|uniref:Nitroreductase family deazaflavin-dependent oxidoreductase n=1 Tax=Nocardia cyriacigeorgica TaxID=135487 RepID=A0A6P1D4S4_9NOCA|nr:nitroreductase family deazaflavin-dependent oxidoreductase [Nocardia cyriacigeorgica]NEW45606.1 nitroreductase family deazaflavin-dependent oxidoreductase [Nocardia cyriacigeorgica]NEW48822.1 nitroreductase family deazaflavin-dependent oxidoreductase [Nocardia cyriacigeorgica]NEW56174.1 nitroreductase family deazaflavin-dependent oxidoreductase [Nocardia cyriacigeorgica]
MAKATRPAGVLRFWRLSGPGAKFLAPINPFFVVIETTGRKSGLPRRMPLARGITDGTVISLVSVHGRRADWVRNIEADPRVRLRTGLRWRTGTAMVEPLTAQQLARFNTYIRSAADRFALDGTEQVLVRVDTGAG